MVDKDAYIDYILGCDDEELVELYNRYRFEYYTLPSGDSRYSQLKFMVNVIKLEISTRIKIIE